jgi:hypothetical protein
MAERHTFQWHLTQTANWCARPDCHHPRDNPIHQVEPADPTVERTDDDLHQAIQAAYRAIHDHALHQVIDGVATCYCQGAGELAVEAAAPILLQATRSDIDGWRTLAQKSERRIGELLEQLQATRDRHADLEVHAADLRDLLERATERLEYSAHETGDYHTWHVAERCRAVLQVDGPARGHAILEEVERLREFERAVRTALQPWYWTGIDADGKSYQDVVAEVTTAHAALDQAAQREVGR